MTRTLTIVSIAVLVLVAVFATTSIAFAQGPATTPGAAPCGIGGGAWSWGPMGITPFSAAAELLGMTTEELSAQLRDGATVLDLAAGKGLTAEDVVAAILAPRVEQIQAAVDDGRITQEQGDLMVQTMTEHISANLEAGTLGLGDCQGLGRGTMGGGRMMGGRGGQGFVDSDGDGVCDSFGTQQRGGRGGRWGTGARSL